jgi:hypothetical protein
MYHLAYNDVMDRWLKIIPRRLLPVFAVSVLWVFAPAQSTLTDYLVSHPWDSAKSGPAIVLEPDGVKSEGPATALADFKRIVLRVGGLSVIAPAEMVLVDDSFSQPPDFYEGLDRNAKILYLLTLLNDDQWSRITSSGISMGDLRGEAKAVMQSILPKPFRWTAWSLGAKVDSGTVPDSQRDRISLKLERGLLFMVNLAGRPDTLTTRSSSDQPGAPGDTVYQREDDDSQHHPFGLQPLKVVANKPKASQLDYSQAALDKSIELPKNATIAETLQRIQQATGVELYGDFRIADKPVRFWGASARAGDLLEGIALTVTGTYRKLGPAYELTSDLTGIGARKLKFAIWEASATREMESRMQLWRTAVARAGHLSEIRFPATSPFKPNAAMQAQLDKSESGQNTHMMPTSEMTGSIRQFLETQDNPNQRIDTTKAMIQANFESVFVLPNGQDLRPEPGLMTPSAFTGDSGQTIPAVSGIPLAPYSMTALNRGKGLRSAIVQAADPSEAGWVVDLLHKYGFKEIWLEATRPEVVKAAADRCKADQVALRLDIRPWALPDDYRADDEDATILGDRGDQLQSRERQFDIWNAFAQEPNEASTDPYRCIGPSSASTFSRWAVFSQLARLPGVGGVVVEDLQPFGYEGRRVPYYHSILEKPMGEMSDFGYSVRERLVFLRAHSLDPIDTIGERLDLQSDIRQPFFPDNARDWGPVTDPPDDRLKALVAEWDKLRADSYQRAAQALLAALPKDLPGGLLVPPARTAINDRARPTIRVEDLALAMPLASDSRQPSNGPTVDVTRVFDRIYRFRANVKDDLSAPADQALYDALSSHASVCLDFRGVSLSDLAAVLDKSFMQVIPITVKKVSSLQF